MAHRVDVDVDLFSGDSPYVSLFINGMQSFIPFRHQMELYVKSPRHDMWSFQDMDEDEFTPDMRLIRDWEWMLVLDGNHKHGTIICSNSETIHGNRFSIHALKNYRTRTNLHLDVSFPIGDEDAREVRVKVWNMMDKICNEYRRSVVTISDKKIQPLGRVCEYVMDCRRYKH